MRTEYYIVILILIIILFTVLKINKADFNLNMNKLLEYLGGKDNIIDTSYNMSRFIVTLKDISIVNKEGIQKLGAKGIVEIDNKLKIVLGRDSKELKKFIDDIK